MKTTGIGTAALCLLLCGCQSADMPETMPDTADKAAEVQPKAEADQAVSEETDDNESNPAAQTEVLQVDDILTDGDSYLGQQISVEGQTPQSMIGDENGIPIGFYYQTGKPGDQDHRIRIEIPEDTPGMSLVTVFGTLDKDQSGYILRTTQTEAVHQTCDDVGHCTKYDE